jgi:hypothetical protein
LTVLNTTLTNVSQLFFALTSGTTYSFAFYVIFRSAATTNGIRVALTFPAATIVSATAWIPVAADGVGGEFQGWITSSGDSVIGPGVETAGLDYIAEISGLIRPSADGNLQVQFAGELSTTLGVVVKAQSVGQLFTVP